MAKKKTKTDAARDRIKMGFVELIPSCHPDGSLVPFLKRKSSDVWLCCSKCEEPQLLLKKSKMVAGVVTT
jgi:hypothetical protein